MRGLTIDIVVMFAAGILAFFLRRSGYSVPGIVLGLILGKIGEQTFAQAMQMLHYDVFGFFLRPYSAILLVAGLLTIAFNLYKAFAGRRAVESIAD